MLTDERLSLLHGPLFRRLRAETELGSVVRPGPPICWGVGTEPIRVGVDIQRVRVVRNPTVAPGAPERLEHPSLAHVITDRFHPAREAARVPAPVAHGWVPHGVRHKCLKAEVV